MVPAAHRTARPLHWISCLLFLFCLSFHSRCPFGNSNVVPNSPHLFWNNLKFTVRLYHWYRGWRKADIFNMLSLYFNYLSTVTLIYLQIYNTQSVASHSWRQWHAVQPCSSWSETTSCKLQDRQCLKGPDFWGKPKNFRVDETMLPPTNPAWTKSEIHMLLISLFQSRCQRKKYYIDGKTKVGRLKPHFLKKAKL